MFVDRHHDGCRSAVGDTEELANDQDLQNCAGDFAVLRPHPQTDEGLAAKQQGHADRQGYSEGRLGSANQKALKFLRLSPCLHVAGHGSEGGGYRRDNLPRIPHQAAAYRIKRDHSDRD